MKKLGSLAAALFCLVWLTGATWLPLFQQASGSGHSVINAGTGIASGGGVESAAITLATNVPIGSQLAIAVKETFTPPTATLTDTQGNTYVFDPNASITSPFVVAIYHSTTTHALTSGTDVITYNDSAATGFNVIYLSAVYLQGYTAYDSATANANTNGFTNSYSLTGRGTAAVPNEVYIAASQTNSTYSAFPTGWSNNPPNSPSSTDFEIGTLVAPTTAAPTWAGNTAGAQNTNSAMVSFQP